MLPSQLWGINKPVGSPLPEHNTEEERLSSFFFFFFFFLAEVVKACAIEKEWWVLGQRPASRPEGHLDQERVVAQCTKGQRAGVVCRPM